MRAAGQDDDVVRVKAPGHPARLMLEVWAICILLYVVLPFQLLTKSLSLHGFVVLFLFIASFCAGTFFIRPAASAAPARSDEPPDFSRADVLLQLLTIVAIASLAVDLYGKSVFDLAKAYEFRAKQAVAILSGASSSSSLAFRLGFLTYPAAYVYLARQVVFERTPSTLRIVALGFLPVLLASLVQGGRGPFFLAFVVTFLSWRLRKTSREHEPALSTSSLAKMLAFVSALAAALAYFARVFFVRADAMNAKAGGLFQYVEEKWGIGFKGFMGNALLDLLGERLTYLVFVFGWYVVSGLVVSNVLFTEYAGPMQLGIYGTDLGMAVMRRIDASLVAQYFHTLVVLGIYGYLPSAFGSLYVDFSYFGLIVCALWGYGSALVYRNARGNDERWLLLLPFVTLGIVFSFVNTPIGVSNGLMTHAWLLAAFALARRPRAIT